MLIYRERISERITKYMDAEGYRLSSGSRFSHSLDAFHYNYQYAGGNRDMIKIEINYSLRAHIFVPVFRNILPDAFDDGMRIHKKDNFQLDERKNIAKEYIANLLVLTDDEKEFLENFEKKEYTPEL